MWLVWFEGHRGIEKVGGNTINQPSLYQGLESTDNAWSLKIKAQWKKYIIILCSMVIYWTPLLYTAKRNILLSKDKLFLTMVVKSENKTNSL